jgi:hypothetical protein
LISSHGFVWTINVVKHRPIWQTSRSIAMQTEPSASPDDRSAGGPAGDPVSAQPEPVAPAAPAPREIGGPPGPEPTRFGDWEKNGRCIDF